MDVSIDRHDLAIRARKAITQAPICNGTVTYLMLLVLLHPQGSKAPSTPSNYPAPLRGFIYSGSQTNDATKP